MKKNASDLSRRQFLISGAIAVTSMAAVGAGVGVIQKVRGRDTRTQDFLRPPGAISEDDFIYGCIKCGLCVQICPIQAIKLAGIKEGLSYGTPYIDVRAQACDFSCDSLQCVETCPTAVLDFSPYKKVGEEAIMNYDKDVTDPDFNPFKVQIQAMKEAVRMGKARLNETTCYAVQGVCSHGGEGSEGRGEGRGQGRRQGGGGGRGLGRGQGQGEERGQGFEGISRGENFKGIYRSPNSDSPNATPLNERVFDRRVCDLCVTECPIGEKAIVMEVQENELGEQSYKPKVLDGCTGCGVCVMVCPTEGPSIIVEPIKS